MNKFKTLDEAWLGFSRHALHEYTPPKVRRSIQGGFYAGVQATLVLIQEAMMPHTENEPTPEEAFACLTSINNKMIEIMSEAQAFMVLAKAAKDSEKTEKEQGNGGTKKGK